MKSWILFLAVALVTTCQIAHASDNRFYRVNWLTNYDEAVKQSQSSSKPIAILFTGSDWCSWCIKLESEVFSSSEFIEAVGDKFIFLKLDFPLNTTLSPDNIAQNKQLQKRFDVSGFPSIIILDAQQQQIGSAGYRPGGGKQYATYLLKMLDDHAAYKQKMLTIDKQPASVSGTDLKHLYEHATECRRQIDINQIAALGTTSDQRHFFLLERYRLLAEQEKINSDEAQAIRKQLLASDLNNLKLTYYQVAIIEFEAACKERENENTSPETTVASLLEYIKKFGDKDKGNLWRLQMIISQVYFDQDKLPEALRYAESSYQTAPPTVQPEIATAIKNIQLQLK